MAMVGNQEMGRGGEAGGYRGGSEEVVGGGRAFVRKALHALEVKAILLQVAGNVLPGEAIHIHELHDGLRHRALDAQVSHSVHESLVELWSPH